MGTKGLFLNPLSGQAILNACVIPTCLSGCENWILNDVLLFSLEAFQGFAEVPLSLGTSDCLRSSINKSKDPLPKTFLSFMDLFTR